jgi:uncharacterized membrane protein YfcA
MRNVAGCLRCLSNDFGYEERRSRLTLPEFNLWVMLFFGVLVGIGASFTGLGGGFLMVPLLLYFGYTAQKSVGTSFLAILIISISALVAHQKLAHVDYRAGLMLGAGGVLGAQLGARWVEHISTGNFRKLFALILVALSAYLLFNK